jgi:hypothetical protein
MGNVVFIVAGGRTAMGGVANISVMTRRGLPGRSSPYGQETNEEDQTLTWTRITEPETVTGLMPAWLGRRMIGLRGTFGLLLTTGDVLRLTSIAAAHQSSDGVVLLDVLLDDAGVPEGVDLAWRSKHFLGSPVQGASVATVNLAHIVAAVEFAVAEMAENPDEKIVPFGDEIEQDLEGVRTEAVGRMEA